MDFVVAKALEYYDANNEIYNKLINKVGFVRYKDGKNDQEKNEIYLFDKDDNLIFKSHYEYLGMYRNIESVWIWSWSIPSFLRKNTDMSRKILNYGLEQQDNIFLKGELVNSRTKVTNVIQIDIKVALTSYLSKQPMILNIKYPEGADYGKIVKNININSETDDVYYFLYILDYKDIDPKLLK